MLPLKADSGKPCDGRLMTAAQRQEDKGLMVEAFDSS